MSTHANHIGRARELRVMIGTLPTGENNSITDVSGVHVGHLSISEGEIQTGITVVSPYAATDENALYFYGKYIDGSGGEMTGYSVMDDFGLLASPVFMANLLSVGRIYNGAITYGFTRGRGLSTSGGWPPIVMGFDDRVLNNMTARRLTEDHALEALDGASSDNAEVGNVGAGVGAVSFGFKGGIGTSSRVIEAAGKMYTVGSLVLANYGSYAEYPDESEANPTENLFPSLLGVVATDAALPSPVLDTLAAGAAYGAAQFGSTRKPAGSYQIVSFSTGITVREPNSDGIYNLEFAPDVTHTELRQGAREATTGAVLSALSAAKTLTGSEGRTAYSMSDEMIGKLIRVAND
ncbi:MAG: P1 family peptidase [Rhodothermia bacterium]|nr:MAG: P1 family peptidase [Rhodothermia bacterium]